MEAEERLRDHPDTANARKDAARARNDELGIAKAPVLKNFYPGPLMTPASKGGDQGDTLTVLRPEKPRRIASPR